MNPCGGVNPHCPSIALSTPHAQHGIKSKSAHAALALETATSPALGQYFIVSRDFAVVLLP